MEERANGQMGTTCLDADRCGLSLRHHDLIGCAMTREQLREKIEPIVADESLNKWDRNLKFLPIMKELLEFYGTGRYEEMFEFWNSTMAEIVIRRKLGRN